MLATGRWLAAALVAVALVTAGLAWALGGSGLAGLLADDAPLYAAAIVWVCVAPVPLLLALGATLRTPWPWVAACALHLVVVTSAAVRLRQLVPGWGWLGVGLSVVLGVASVVALTGRSSRGPSRVAAPPRRPAGAPAPAPGVPTCPPRG